MDDRQLDQAIMQMREDLAAMKTELKSTWRRIDEQKSLAESVHTLALSVRDLTNAQKNNTDAITDLRKDVDELQTKPAKRWDGVVGTIITALVTATITFVITQVGLK